MNKTRTIEISIEETVELAVQNAHLAANRVSMLMSYALNSSAYAPRASFHLPGFVQLIDAPAELNQEQRERFLEDYAAWVVGNGYRELLTGMEGFLDLYFKLVLALEKLRKKRSEEKAAELLSNFKRRGVAEKLNQLQKHYEFVTGFGHYFVSLTQARNCLVHRRGIVGEEDCDGIGKLEIMWLGIDARFIEPDGTVREIGPETEGPFDTSGFSGEGNAKLEIKMVDRTQSFSMGERIDISPRHLQEICSMVSYVCAKLGQLLVNWMLDQGMFVNNGERVPDPKPEIWLASTENET